MATQQDRWLARSVAFNNSRSSTYKSRVAPAYFTAGITTDAAAAQLQLNKDLAVAFGTRRDWVGKALAKSYDQAAKGLSSGLPFLAAPDFTKDAAGAITIALAQPAGVPNSSVSRAYIFIVGAKGMVLALRSTAGYGWVASINTSKFADGDYDVVGRITYTDGSVGVSLPKTLTIKNVVAALMGTKVGFSLGLEAIGLNNDPYPNTDIGFSTPPWAVYEVPNGITGGDVAFKERADRIKAMGGKWIRVDTLTANANRLTEMDNIINYATSIGLKFIACAVQGAGGTNAFGGGIANWVNTVLNRWGTKITAIQIGNEVAAGNRDPNFSGDAALSLSGFNSGGLDPNDRGGPAGYAQVIHDAFVAARANGTHPNVIVLVGSVCSHNVGGPSGPDADAGGWRPERWIAAMCDAVVAGSLKVGGVFPWDAIVGHPYVNTSQADKDPRGFNFSGGPIMLQQMHDAAVARGDPGKVWVTEFGWYFDAPGAANIPTWYDHMLNDIRAFDWMGPFMIFTFDGDANTPGNDQSRAGIIDMNRGVNIAAVPKRPWYDTVSWIMNVGQNTAADKAADLDEVVNTGATYVRIVVNWNLVTPTALLTYAWARLDEWLNAAATRNVKVLLCPTGNTPFASLSNDRLMGPTNSTHQDSFAQFCKDLVNHAKTILPMSKIAGIEVWDAPNYNVKWHVNAPNVVDYTNLLKKCYPKIKEADSGITVVTGGAFPHGDLAVTPTDPLSPPNWVQGIYTNGGKNFFDAVGVQPYDWKFPPPQNIVKGQPNWGWRALSLVKEVYQVMSDNADGAKKIWGTEIGGADGNPAKSSEFITSTEMQAVVNATLNIWFSDYKAFTGPLIFHRLRDQFTSDADPSTNFGAMDPSRLFKRAWHGDLKTKLAGALP